MQISQFLSKTTSSQRTKRRFFSLFLLVTLLILGGSGQVFARGNDATAVYVMNNDATANAVLVFERAADGTLSEAGSYLTGGVGTGGGLGSQGAVALSDNGRYLFTVNAGSNEISVFAADGTTLHLTDTVPSGGERPISLTVHGRILYVLNAGGSGNITGFFVRGNGRLSPIHNATQHLSNNGVGDAPGPAQVSFTPDGRQLVVTEKGSNLILTYAVSRSGQAGAATITASEGITPFGFDFTPGGIIVSEAFGGAADASAASSYNFSHGTLQVVSSSVATTQTAACWVIVTPDGKYAYTTNTGSSSVTGLKVSPNGSIELLDANGRTGETGDGTSPIDAIISSDGATLYVLSGGASIVTAFHIAADGSLTNLGHVSVPVGSVGITAN
ncbi:MAG: beta-propeller fold lactonase family protein [Ardenticatenaceae bacterium]|nr:beta-propeller fold lactonase family protein [Anaerolineales bacterium]MCB8981338.1 beta-propeller fold lactonase family protein [Ardenticatenaceae bacterium]